MSHPKCQMVHLTLANVKLADYEVIQNTCQCHVKLVTHYYEGVSNYFHLQSRYV